MRSPDIQVQREYREPSGPRPYHVRDLRTLEEIAQFFSPGELNKGRQIDGRAALRPVWARNSREVFYLDQRNDDGCCDSAQADEERLS
jgi:hypothetical protein